MKIHEYQAKDILERYGVAVPKGEVANTLEEAMDVAKRLVRGRAPRGSWSRPRSMPAAGEKAAALR